LPGLHLEPAASDVRAAQLQHVALAQTRQALQEDVAAQPSWRIATGPDADEALELEGLQVARAGRLGVPAHAVARVFSDLESRLAQRPSVGRRQQRDLAVRPHWRRLPVAVGTLPKVR